jgi:biopolymer transport protein ExbD
MRRWGFSKNKTKIISEINITPLTDVVMVLLVIFMVTTPLMMNEAFKIKLPTATTSEPQPEQTTTVSVTYPGNVIYLNKAQVSMEDLKGLLASRMATSPDKTVVIKADKSVLHGVVVKVLDIAKESGALKLAIATEREKEKK